MPHDADVLARASIDLSSVDPAAYEGLGLEEVADLLRARARAAGPAALSLLLDGPGAVRAPGPPDEGLVERYVARRLATIRGLRDLRAAFAQGAGRNA